MLSSTNANREHIYVQQPPISASGFSSQAFNPHYPHTERKVETKTCTDCHLSSANDNNAIMAQLLMYGTNFVNFVGYNAYVGGAGRDRARSTSPSGTSRRRSSAATCTSTPIRTGTPRITKHGQAAAACRAARSAGVARCLQLRGEYLYVAEGRAGMRVYDVASIGNKGVSQR